MSRSNAGGGGRALSRADGVLTTETVDGELRFVEIGRTVAGRVLKVVTTDRQDKIRVVTAFAPSAREANEYRREVLASMIDVPKFANETDEADWWYDNRERHGDEFAAASEAGRVRWGSGVVQYLAQLEKAQELLPNREDAVHLAKLAFKKGVDAEVYLQELVHKAIVQELDSAA